MPIKPIAPEDRAKVIFLYFDNLDKSFDWLVHQMDGKLTYYQCDKIVQDYIKSGKKKKEFITVSSKMNYESN
mgnify:CR=1 FL=1